MLKKINTYLLTHYPLLWNTRLVPAALSLLIIHLLFFLGGFSEMTAALFQRQTSLEGVLSGSLLTFSILCSLAVIIFWLVFYLRNNAFRSFFIIDRFHSVKEFIIIFFVLFFSITFFETYKWGNWLKARSITGSVQLAREANTANLAMAFIPMNKSDYFKLNHCTDSSRIQYTYQENHDYFDSTQAGYYNPDHAMIRKALREKDAFSYMNYCESFIDLPAYPGFAAKAVWMQQRDRWIDQGQRDSIHRVLEDFFALCKKYDIGFRMDADELTGLVFADPARQVTKTFSSFFSENRYEETKAYVMTYDLRYALSFADSCLLDNQHSNDTVDIWIAELYTALCLSILLLTYRMYSRRVFLVSVVGSIVWTIFLLLAGSTSGSESFIFWIYLILGSLFLLIGLALLKENSNKTVTGVLLNWHLYTIPFFFIFIAFLVQHAYDNHNYQYINSIGGGLLPEKQHYMKTHYPVGYWVSHHMPLIFRLNLLLVFLYIAFIFTRLSRKWHIMPEE